MERRVGAGAHSVRRSLVGVEASEDPCPRGVLALRLVALPPPNESGFISCNLFCIAAMRRSISLHLSDPTIDGWGESSAADLSQPCRPFLGIPGR